MEFELNLLVMNYQMFTNGSDARSNVSSLQNYFNLHCEPWISDSENSHTMHTNHFAKLPKIMNTRKALHEYL